MLNRFFIIALSLATTWGGEKVLIRSAKPYDALAAAIRQNGGTVTHQYKYVDAIAADIPSGALPAIAALVPPGAVTKDSVLDSPKPVNSWSKKNLATPAADLSSLAADSAQALNGAEVAGLAGSTPDAYLINNSMTRVSVLHAAGKTGSGMIVAVIDSGIRPGFPSLSLDGSVIGCEDFVGDGLGCSNFANGGHGTFVAGMISANVVFTFATASSLRNAVLAECPACFLNPPVNTQIPMIGSAPLSSIYALRVFPPTGGAPTSIILQALERAIELREKYDAGQPGGANIRVVNLSLGGSTVYAGRDVFDSMMNVVLAKDIVPVTSAGNAGPATLTVGSPGTAFGAITVGAASVAANERIYRRSQYGPATGALYRPFLGTQTSYFSSRGPDANGAVDPDVVANGFASYGQGFGATVNSISLGSGTSFSSPTVAGIAAVLRQAYPTATARQIRNAIIMSANPALLADGSINLDRGNGFVDAEAAANLLASGSAPDTLVIPGNADQSVKVNIEKGSSLNVRDGQVTETISGLKPGQRYDIPYRVNPNTKQVIVALSGVTPALPPAQQNQLFGDDILMAVHSAKTSAIGEGDYKVFEFTSGGTFAVNNPEPGILRVSVNGDWTNAGTISANVTIISVADPIPQFTSQGKVDPGQLIVIPVTVPPDVQSAEFRLSWRADWGTYPANDIDLILISPSGTVIANAATVNNPEIATVVKPAAGIWTALIAGFEIWTGDEKYEFRVALDGNVVKK
jgi:hypothetical protein